jgi:hypothetical protein
MSEIIEDYEQNIKYFKKNLFEYYNFMNELSNKDFFLIELYNLFGNKENDDLKLNSKTNFKSSISNSSDKFIKKPISNIRPRFNSINGGNFTFKENVAFIGRILKSKIDINVDDSVEYKLKISFKPNSNLVNYVFEIDYTPIYNTENIMIHANLINIKTDEDINNFIKKYYIL